MVDRNRLHHLVNHFAAYLCAHNIDLRSVCLGDLQESHPVAVPHFATECKSDFIVKTETVTNLRKKSLRIKNLYENI